ncbi:MAG: hypothetical protein VW492_07995 [Deltaproteobacteria bacterium]
MKEATQNIIKYFILAISFAVTGISCSNNAEQPPNIKFARSHFDACDRIGDYNEVRQCEIQINERRYRNAQLQTVFQEKKPPTPDRSSEPVILAPNLP